MKAVLMSVTGRITFYPPNDIITYMEGDVERAVNILKNSGIVIFPTDTAFGIGCRIDNEKAVERLFEIRKRPKTQATPVLVSSIEMAREYVEDIDRDIIERLIKPYWPGGLTIVFKAKIDRVPQLVRGGGDTIGIRMPNHPTALEIIKGVGVPILGPSANFHGEATPYEAGDLDKNLIKQVDYIVTGECTIKQASTVIDCTIMPWRIVREGGVKINL